MSNVNYCLVNKSSLSLYSSMPGHVFGFELSLIWSYFVSSHPIISSFYAYNSIPARPWFASSWLTDWLIDWLIDWPSPPTCHVWYPDCSCVIGNQISIVVSVANLQLFQSTSPPASSVTTFPLSIIHSILCCWRRNIFIWLDVRPTDTKFNIALCQPYKNTSRRSQWRPFLPHDAL